MASLLPLQCITKMCKILYLVLSCVEAKKTMQSLLRDVARCCKEVPFHQTCCEYTECTCAEVQHAGGLTNFFFCFGGGVGGGGGGGGGIPFFLIHFIQ